MAAFCQSIWLLSVAHLLIGFSTAASFGPLIADISHWFERRRGIAVAVAASGNYFSGAIWPMLLSGVLIDAGWRWVYLVLAAVTVLAVVPLAMLLRPRLEDGGGSVSAGVSGRPAVTINISPRKLQILLAIAGVGCCVAMSMPQVHIVALSVDLGYGATAGAQMLSGMLMGGRGLTHHFGICRR